MATGKILAWSPMRAPRAFAGG